ncbi:aromatic ring-hydroxylating dioxygenase subunit alpha [Ovoidimarina sediminis]|uniref:aromatic ring-hydroxylating dioxygenase subunit alpha n=1 Tax=Ovoidimarina sediminis TaxID=3079856 RepID=UPI00290E3A1A|nr:aromatic ring-hydroxylating dioxygenase subunit alpha [Rhodophyticola sp. MJ-SS7]MDU8943259.1 aromatic ring-hydroxylating dioxygenase subunit alpha [Rhodophyticola sp. MJ-SS7]
MISSEMNDRLTRVEAGTGAGAVLRQYWQPAALAVELDGARPVVPVRLMGEDLVLFRDNGGALGLIGRYCPHRGVDLCFGRRENNGLRCPFHGWHFDRGGQCVEQPGEPEDSRMHERIRTTSYPVVERNGIVWAFMGAGEPPAFPSFDCFEAPETHVFAFKGLWECNWLQALEIGIDPAHASFLHRFLQDEDPAEGYGKQFRDKAGSTEIPMTRLLREYPRPDIRVEPTASGLRLLALRHLDDGRTHVRVTNQVFPNAICIPMSREMTITQWHVPVDDETCYWYAMFTSFGAPVDKEVMRAQRMKEHRLPDYAPLKNRANNYGYDPDEQATATYTGMGMDINVHDQWAVESMGTIQDRTREHLGKTDVAIIAYRRMLRDAIAAVEEEAFAQLPLSDPAVADGPVAIDAIGPAEAWEEIWAAADQERRGPCPWIRTAAE